MKLKAFLVAALVAGLAVSAAVASPPPGNGKDKSKPAKTEKPAKPESAEHAAKGRGKCKRSIVLKGLYVSGSADANGMGSFEMLVKKANKHGTKLDLVGKQVSINVDGKTKIHRHGKAKLSDLQKDDRLHVKARMVCAEQPAEGAGAQGAEPAAPSLLARKVDAKGPKPAKGDDDENGTTTGTTESTPNVETQPVSTT